MKDKETQIEEMARTFGGCYITPNYKVCCAYSGSTDCPNKTRAERLYEQGYRKISEDSVINTPTVQTYSTHDNDLVALSREEYENIYEQAEQNVLANIADGGTSCHWCIEQHERKASKETVEKIIDLIKTFCSDKKFVEVITHIISERFGVEIKE